MLSPCLELRIICVEYSRSEAVGQNVSKVILFQGGSLDGYCYIRSWCPFLQISPFLLLGVVSIELGNDSILYRGKALLFSIFRVKSYCIKQERCVKQELWRRKVFLESSSGNTMAKFRK